MSDIMPAKPDLDQHRHWMLKYARSLVRDQSEADDVVQQALLEAWKKSNFPTCENEQRALLATIVKRKARALEKLRNALSTDPAISLHIGNSVISARPKASPFAALNLEDIDALLAWGSLAGYAERYWPQTG